MNQQNGETKSETDLVEKSADLIKNMVARFPFSSNQPAHKRPEETGKLAIFVNKSIFHETLKFFKLDYQPKSWDHECQIGEKIFEMKLIMITIENNERVTFIQNLILMSQYSMPWLDRLTLFSDLNSSKILEDFIHDHRLKPHIVSIDDRKGPSLNDNIIRVVTFSDHVDKFGLIKKFGDVIKPRLIQYFFITCAFPWHQPSELKQIRIPWTDHCLLHSTLPIILHHLSLIDYTNELNIFDLIALKLAISDFPMDSNYLSNEIDYFIARSLRKMMRNKTYLVNNQFNLTQFQNYVETLRYNYRDSSGNPIKRILYRTILLTGRDDPIQILDSKSNIEFIIDGSNFGAMSSRLFGDLLAHDCVSEIVLNTDFAWINNYDETLTRRNNSQHLKVNFIGSNNANFIEDFVAYLKTKSCSETLELTITQSISNAMIFDNFSCAALHFLGVLVDTNLLTALNQINLSQIKSLKFISCRFENKVENWELYYSTTHIIGFEIREDEWIWQYLFEFIVERLLNSTNGGFKWDRDAVIVSDGVPISLSKLSFGFDEFKTKIELIDANMETIDLYELKLSLMLSEN